MTKPRVSIREKLWFQASIAALLVASIHLLFRLRYDFTPVDDAYIHLRVARNLADGFGPVFNPGDRVEVSTSPAWTLLVGLGLWLGAGDFFTLSTLGLLCAAWAGATTAVLGRALAGTLGAFVAPLMLGTLSSFVCWSASGMETPLAILGLALAAQAALSARGPAGVLRAGLMAGLLVVIRPEAMAVFPSLLLVSLWPLPSHERARGAVLGTLAFAAVIALLFVSRYAYFHEWLPNTYYAKMGDGGVTLRVRGLVYLLKFAVFHAVYVLLAGYTLWRRQSEALKLGLIASNWAAAIAWSGGDHFWYARLVLPVLPLVCALSAAALTSFAHPRARALAFGAVLLLAVPWNHRARVPGHEPELDVHMMSVLFAKQSAEIGRSIAQMPAGTVATTGIGAIGYVSERPILDLVGLADKHIARAKPLPGGVSGHNHSDVAYVLERAPEIVIPYGWFETPALTDQSELAALRRDPSWLAALTLVTDPRFRLRYTPRIYTHQGQHLRVWLRADLTNQPVSEPSPAPSER